MKAKRLWHMDFQRKRLGFRRFDGLFRGEPGGLCRGRDAEAHRQVGGLDGQEAPRV